MTTDPEPVDVWGLTPPPVTKVAAWVPVTEEVLEDAGWCRDSIDIRGEAPYGTLIREMWEAADLDRRLTEEIGPMLRPTRYDYNLILEPARRHQAKVDSMRYNLRWVKGHIAGDFIRAPKR